MDEIIFNSSSEVCHEKFCSSEDGSEMKDVAVDNLLSEDAHCNNKTAVEGVTADEMPETGHTKTMEPIDTAAGQTCNTAADDNDVQTSARLSNTSAECRRTEVENPSQPIPEEDKNMDTSGTADDGQPKLAMDKVQQKFAAFHQLDRPANVVIDLRSPRLVQVCLLHGTDDVGAGGSSSSSSTGAKRQPQTARRGHRRRHLHTTDRTTHAVTSDDEQASVSCHPGDSTVPSSQTVPRRSIGETATAEQSTIIHLKMVGSPDEKLMDAQPDNAALGSQVQLRHSAGDHSSESSDDSTMRVRNVNRTYSRTPSLPAAQKTPRLLTAAKSTNCKKGLEELSDSNTRTTSPRTQELKSVPKKSKKTGKRRPRIGPAWFSRQFLDAPPPEIWKCARTSRTLKILKRPNYDCGVRHLPIAAEPATVKRVLEVPVNEETDIDSVGREQLRLWRLTDDDMDELLSQLRQEAEHRRSEHNMPLIMQMTDAQIEHAYEQVAESMKTYEIVEADSDEDMPEDEESDDYNENNSGHLESPDWRVFGEVGAKGLGETEYSRLRPKRHAVDYGPSAFTSIMIMEGRRFTARPRKSSKESQMKSSPDVADRTGLQRHSRRHKSRRRKKRTIKSNEQMYEASMESAAMRHASNIDDNTG